jgi:quercetin dioxygenase-like cupin family protein
VILVQELTDMGVIHKRIPGDDIWRWENVEVQSYTSNNATKEVLIGRDEGANNFEVRYFTIPPRGFSSLDHHAHDHGVVVIQGRAKVMLGDEFDEVGPGDVVYIPSWERHQFENLTDEPFTFLCIIPPKPVQTETSAAPVADAVTKT